MTQRISVELNLIDHITKNMEAINRRLDSHFKQMETGATRTKKAFGDHTVGVNQLRGAYTAVAGVAGGLLARSLVDASLGAERLNRTMEFAAGSAMGGAEMMRFVRAEAGRLGLDLQTTASDFARLSAAAKGTSMEGQVARDVFIGVSEAATTLGLSADQTSGALQAIQQMVSKGTVQAEELRGQLGERLPGAFQIAARSMGVTTAQLGKMLEQGQVISDQFLPKFAAELHRTYGDSAVAAAASGQAAFNRFSTAMYDAKVQLGDSLMPTITAAVNSMTKALKEATESGLFTRLGQDIMTAANAGKDLFLAYGAAKLLAMANGFDKAAFAASGMGKALAFVKGNWVLLGIGAMAAALDVFIDRWDRAVSKMAGQDIRNNLGNAEAMRTALDSWKAQNQAIKDLTASKKLLEDASRNQNIPAGRAEILRIERMLEEAKGKFKEAQEQVKAIGGVGFSVTEGNVDRLIQGIDRQVQSLKDKSRQGGEGVPGLPSKAEIESQGIAVVAVFEAMAAGIQRSDEAAKAFQDAMNNVEQDALDLARDKKTADKERLEIIKQINLAIATDPSQNDWDAKTAAAQAHYQELANLAKANINDQIELKKTLQSIEEAHEAAKIRIAVEGIQASSAIATQGMAALVGEYKSFANVYRGFAHFQNMVDTYAAATAAYKSAASIPLVGWLLAPAAAAAAVVGGLANASRINSQKFEMGGPVIGPSHRNGGVQAELEGGEVVWSKRDVNRWGGMAAVDSMRQGSGGWAPAAPMTVMAPLSVTVQGNADRQTVQEIEELSQAHVDRVAKAMARAHDQRHPELRSMFPR